MDIEEREDGIEYSRNSLQKVAMSAIYDALTYQKMGKPVNVEDIVSSLMDLPYEECDFFVKAAVIFSLKYQDDIIAIYSQNMVKWTFDRLNRVEQAILLLAYVHFFYIEPEVDRAVVINIAIRLAKDYLGDKDYRFVNAILDKVLVRA